MAASVTDPQTRVTLDSAGTFQRFTLQNDCLSVSFLPELGGKMSSLKRLEGGHEFLLQPMKPYRRATYADRFEDYDTSGFDDCFPSVSACEYPGESDAVPDHGELWSVPWQAETCGDTLLLTVSGRRFPYIFRKRVRLETSKVVLSYDVENTGSEPVKFLWSAHPLLAVTPGCQIVLPKEVNDMLVHWSREDRLGACGHTFSWPIVRDRDGNKVNLSELKSAEERTADKLFTPRLTDGRCAVYYPESDDSLAFHFDTSAVPYLGVWICQGGWPHPDRGHFTMALEPCSGRPDSLAEAAKTQECQVLPARGKQSWELTIEVQKGRPRPSSSMSDPGKRSRKV